jgi:membrane-bound metal-dependent hydrolase YbcI (DUF457 family)
MPNHKTHLFGGFLVFLIALFSCISAAFFIDPLIFPSLLGICLLGALFPDIDTTSKIRYLWLVTTLFGACICWWLFPPGLAGLLLSVGVIPLLVPHRGITHQIWFLACMAIATGYGVTLLIPAQTDLIMLHGVFFFVGAASHVLLDRLGSRFKRR